MWDAKDLRPKMPMGSSGFRWGKEKGKWNLILKDGVDGSEIDPTLTFLPASDGVVQARFDDFGEGRTILRGIPVKKIRTADGKTVTVATVYDLLMAQYGVSRGLPGEYPRDYDDDSQPYTPAWAEKYTGMGRDVVIRFAREWAKTAELTKGRCMVIIGAGVNHWYHANLMYRAAIHALMFSGCVGVNGGGLAHYVGQEKLAPMEPWSAIAFARDWFPASRLQNAPSWHYIHTDQWRYEKSFTDYHTVPADQKPGSLATGHTADTQVRAVRNGWLPFYPQFNLNPLELVKQAEAAGAKNQDEINAYVVRQLSENKLKFSVEDPDAPENWPRIWFIWRGNALLASAKGHEFFLKHYLGTHTNAIAEDMAKDSVQEIAWHETAPVGKMDLVVDLNFRMDTSALYSDIVLPAATWYEKADLNTTDMHSFIHPLSAAVPPVLGIEERLADFRGRREKVFGTRAAALSGARVGFSGFATRARHARGDRTAIDRGLETRRGRSRFPARRCLDSRSSPETTAISTTSSFPSGRSFAKTVSAFMARAMPWTISTTNAFGRCRRVLGEGNGIHHLPTMKTPAT